MESTCCCLGDLEGAALLKGGLGRDGAAQPYTSKDTCVPKL